MSENILAQEVKMKYVEPALETNFEEFRKVVESRRSVRVYDGTPVPEKDVQTALDMALLAPNSSNLQTWEFVWVRTPELKKQLEVACLGQQSAKTAPVLIVCVAKPALWKKHTRQMIEFFDAQKEDVPAVARTYYSKITYMAYGLGPLNLFGFVKRLIFFVTKFFRVTPRGPVNFAELKEWAVKSTALGCENLMLAFRALGYDSCPMEGFDESRVKKIIGAGRKDSIVMVVSAGKRVPGAIYGPQVRFPREQFIKVL